MAPKALLVALLVIARSLLGTSRRLNQQMTPSAASASAIVAFAPGNKKKKKKSAPAKGEDKTVPKMNLKQLAQKNLILNLKQPQELSKTSPTNGTTSGKSLLKDLEHARVKAPEELLKNLAAMFPELNLNMKQLETPEDMVRDLEVATLPELDRNMKQDLSKPGLKDDTTTGKSVKTPEDTVKDLSEPSPRDGPISGKGLKTEDMVKNLAAMFPELNVSYESLRKSFQSGKTPEDMFKDLDLDRHLDTLQDDIISGESLKTPGDTVKDLSEPSLKDDTISGKSLKEEVKDLAAELGYTSHVEQHDMISDKSLKTPEDIIKNLAAMFPKLNVSYESLRESVQSGKTPEEMFKDLLELERHLDTLPDDITGGKRLNTLEDTVKDLSEPNLKDDTISGKSSKEEVKDLAAEFGYTLHVKVERHDKISGRSSKTPEDMVKKLASRIQMIKDLAESFQMTSLDLRIWQLRFGRDNYEKADQVIQALATPFVGIVTRSGSEPVLVDASTPMTKKQLVEYLQLRGSSQATITQSAEQFFIKHEKLTFPQFARVSLSKHDLFSRAFLEVLPLQSASYT